MEYASIDKRLLTLPQVKASIIDTGTRHHRNVLFKCLACNQNSFLVAREKNTVAITYKCMNEEFVVILKNEEEGILSAI